ncbi:hypothetical protein [Pseudomonas putida]|uniref:hypothetical protein n=1 Tax=Pseudomonas putida TaxID=303 RepID=UPI002364189E|nr:hypothetical protein [Pseudomonas putida]MDD1987189.1 hypothetical protein [Pseudomonas putida]HDS1794085.1 hypothetical protein [Pseudomonas putida]
MQRWQFLASGLGHDTKLVIRDCLEQGLGQKAKALNLFWRGAAILGLVILAHGVDSLLYQRLTGFDHSNECAFVQFHDLGS